MRYRLFCRATCAKCDQDIENLGNRQWLDRGGNRACVSRMVKGEIVKPKPGQKHSPYGGGLVMAVLKKDSAAWQLAVKRYRRRHCMSRPVSLSEDGLVVTLQSMIRGNRWTHTLCELQLLEILK